jgi:hypothetical protein
MLLSHSYIPYIHIVHAPTPSPKAKLRQRRTRKKGKEANGCRSRSIRSELHHVRSSHTPGIKETRMVFPFSLMKRVR